MATTDDHKVPSTILSRTQRFEFKSISNIDISKYLTTILDRQNIIYSDEGISIIAQKADGSMRDALSLLDQVIAYNEDELSLEMIQDVFENHSTWADLPHKFEAGTPAIGEAIGMDAAIK